MDASQFEKRLRVIVPSHDEAHIDALNELVKQSAEARSDPKTAAAIFAYMEKYPDAYLGAPGPLVHFIEKSFPAYTSELIASIKRRPVGHTLWMANRILNASIDTGLREELICSLQEAVHHPLASEDERQRANEFLQLQSP